MNSAFAKHIVVFVEVVKAGNFRSAASNLRMSLSSVSRAIEQLEVDCGAPLFRQDGGRFQVTEFGVLLYQRTSKACSYMNSEYNTFKRKNRHLNLLIPPQLHSSVIVDRLVKYSSGSDTQVSFDILSNMGSRESAYDALISSQIDFMFDIVPNRSASFTSELVSSHKMFWVGSKSHYTELSDSDIESENAKFAKIRWLGKAGELLEQKYGVLSEEKVGFITQDTAMYYDMIEKTDYIGLASEENVDWLKRDFVLSQTPAATLDLYFVSTKASLFHRPEIAWFHNALFNGSDIKLTQL